MGCNFKVHRKNERSVSIDKAHLKHRSTRKKEPKGESAEGEKQFFSWRITKGDSVMNRKDAIHENEPYILVEGTGWDNTEFYGKWILAAAKAKTLWNKAIKDRIFKKEVELLTVIYIPDFGKAAIFFFRSFRRIIAASWFV